MPRWLSLLLGVIVCVVVAVVLAPYVPDPGDNIVAIVAWLVAAVLFIAAIVDLVRGGV